MAPKVFESIEQRWKALMGHPNKYATSKCGDAPVLFGSNVPECRVSATRRASSQFQDIELIDLRDGRNAYVESTRITTPNVHHFIPSFSRPTRSIICQLCELGWFFRKVRGYISESIKDQQFEVSTVGQAFCSALQDELSDYYKLLAVLESQYANPIPSAEFDFGGSPENYLSLRRLFVWLAEPMMRMRLMALLVDGCQELRGGAMAGVIHAHAQHGNPLV
ncbi:hypothetical protein MA16_Dca011572 [Dendrobium catenatum]|uniref:Gamma tubulin complex component protein N-terminal domain-containing protein n=1 Tax=Dendrobium catenatum TaxID=906689 RepID=A0A2I0WQK5_9ASPA|nr:hypothetical protein MA16_Dca011572 [Dendrobium catenatum]